MKLISVVLLCLCCVAGTASAQTPDATKCEPDVIDSPLSIVAGTTLIVAFCAAAGTDAYAIWVDGELITLTGALQQSPNMSTTGLRQYFAPAYTKAILAGRHVLSVLVGKFNPTTGKTDISSAPSMPQTLFVSAVPPPADCTGQVRLSIGEAKPRVVGPQGQVEVTFSLQLSKVPVTSLEIRLNGTALPSSMISGPDLRGVGSFRFQAPDAVGEYSISMIIFGDNGCTDGVDRYIPITVKR